VSRGIIFGFLLLPALVWAQPAPLAITHVTVIDGTGAAPRAGMTVVISDERITALGSSSELVPPKDARVVHAAGKFVIPGLWDMHVHWNDAAYLPLFIANGVTGIRIMWGRPAHLQWRRDIAEGRLAGPRIVLAGSIVDGPKPFWPGSTAAATADEGRQAVERTRAEGYDFVKVYNSVPREVFLAMAEEARKQNIPVAGHVPNAVGAGEASDAGQKTMEHLQGLLLAVSSIENQLRDDFAAANKLPAGPERRALLRRLGVRVLETYEANKAAALFAKLKANGTWQVPTFTVLHSIGHLHDPQHTSDPRVKFMPPWVRTLWNPAKDFRFRNLVAEDFAQQKRFFERRLALVGEMHAAGVGILAGSDTLNPYCFPGFSLHDELGWLVKAGLSPMAALQAATRNPAIYLGRMQDFGTVERGKIADLVLLDADPIADIRNTRSIAAVVMQGKLLQRSDLDRMLADIERLANTN
jgi:imidazolonepropionase-like amidohydrolase